MNITQVPIPAYNGTTGNYMVDRQGTQVDTIVYHHIDGTLTAADAVFTNPKSIKSAHRAIGDTEVHEYVKLTDTAFGAGNWAMNLRCINKEHADLPGGGFSDETYETSAQDTYAIALFFGKKVAEFRHIPHSAVVPTACPAGLDIARIVTRAMALETAAQVTAVLTSAPIKVPVVEEFMPFQTDLAPSQTYSAEVKRMQQYLEVKGFFTDQGNQDGYYGPKTQAAVHAFQGKHGILNTTEYGWWYPQTRAAANADLTIQPTTNA